MKASPVFRSEIQELQARFSDSKQRFDPSIISGCVRCRFGRVQVLVCRPFSRRMRPFPTTFWLVCPYLVKRAGMVESQGGVGELEEYMTSRGMLHEWREYNRLHQAVRLKLMDRHTLKFMGRFCANKFRSVMSSGVGGMRYGSGITVKCLHLQTASLIAIGSHPGGEWLRSRGLWRECGCECPASCRSQRDSLGH